MKTTADLRFHDNPYVGTVGSFAELLAARFARGVNAICWPRSLPGDFGEVTASLGQGEGVVRLDSDHLRNLPLGPAGRIARDILIADFELLREQGLTPELNCIHAYPRDAMATVPTDVYSFHADRAPVETATWLCTYYGAPSEGLRNDEALRRIDHPATRAALLREYGGNDDAGFRDFLREHCYDLHYVPVPQAQPWSFEVGCLWRIAIDWPGSPVPPCIHRAPVQSAGGTPRLLLIS
ncbi:MAG TPA: hypothetical protein VG734_12335 [Lacunisphaera sp.]|nr:hypothetical protein [Lacunisphaera sp.]